MTSEIRTSFDLSDIAGIEIGCRECSATVLYPTGEKNQERIIGQCPNCGVRLFASSGHDTPVAVEQIRLLMRTLKLLAAPSTEQHAKVRIQVKPISQK